MEQNAHRAISIALAVGKEALLRLFSYVVARDYGFAPNPFYGICSLATCKPGIRKAGSVGDWVVGTGSKKNKRGGYLVFAMRITETATFNDYWQDQRFQCKKPNLRGSKKQAFGDNIYFREGLSGQWQQRDSHHSYRNGVPNQHNIRTDTQVDRVLLSGEYSYWGGAGPKIPAEFRHYEGFDICCGYQNYKSQFPVGLIREFVSWLMCLERGYLGSPLDWSRTP